MSAPNKNVLLVEDDDSMRRFIEVILNRAGYETVSAKDGLEGLNLTLEQKFDAIVADAIMPNLSGYDLCRMVKQNPHSQDTVYILLSGLENNNGHDLADAYLTKSQNLKDELIAKLSELLV